MYHVSVLGTMSVAALLGVLQARASSIEAYAFTAAGQSSCATFAPTAQVSKTIGSGSIEVATPGAGCNVAQNLMDVTGAAGLQNAHSAAAGGGNTEFGTFSYTGTSRSQGDYNTLGVEAEGSLSGATDAIQASKGFSRTRGEQWPACEPVVPGLCATFLFDSLDDFMAAVAPHLPALRTDMRITDLAACGVLTYQ